MPQGSESAAENINLSKQTLAETEWCQVSSHNNAYRVDPSKTAVHKYFVFPRTIIDWNNLEQEKVSSKTSESFKTQIPHCP